jgi:3-hydroxy acid dehydrogenase / malonic semialdehyde reductase
MNKTVLITGATAGIGKETAFRFAKEGHRLIICARRKNRLDELVEKIKSEYKVDALALALDVRDNELVQQCLLDLPENWRNIDILVNNAGLALGLNTIDDGNIEDWNVMIDTNIKGLLYMTKYCIPYLEKSSCPQIINIGSIAGKEAYPKGNVYCATKHAVDALTKSMRIDLLEKGIKVSQVAPGAVETEFSIVRFKGDKTKAEKVYQNYQPLRGEDIADVVYYVSNLPMHVTINDVLVMPTAQAAAGIFHKEN